MFGSSSLFPRSLVRSKLLVQVGSTSHLADAGWREPGFGMWLRALQRLGLVEVGVPGACRAAIGAQQQSPNWGTFPRGRSAPAPLSCLARGFCWRLSGSSKFGRKQYCFCWERWKTKAALLLWLPQTVFNAMSCQAALQADVLQLESKAIPPRCEHGMAGHAHCPLCSHSLPWDAGCALGCVSPSWALSRTLPGSKTPLSESSAGDRGSMVFTLSNACRCLKITREYLSFK